MRQAGDWFAFPPLRQPRYNAGMAVALAIFGVAFAAFCVWLSVRIVNQRERWAKWTAAALIAMLAGYPLSIGPACWALRNGFLPDKQRRNAASFYLPILVMEEDGPEFASEIIVRYIALWQ